jgi:hypothetical protein
MVNHNSRCFECGYEEVRDIKNANDAWRGACEECGKAQSVRRIMSAPHIGMTEDQQISAMQSSFRQDYYKKGIDDVRHKHGVAADDAARGAAAKKVKDALDNKGTKI